MPGVSRFARAANERNVRIADNPDEALLREAGTAGTGEPPAMAVMNRTSEGFCLADVGSSQRGPVPAKMKTDRIAVH